MTRAVKLEPALGKHGNQTTAQEHTSRELGRLTDHLYPGAKDSAPSTVTDTLSGQRRTDTASPTSPSPNRVSADATAPIQLRPTTRRFSGQLATPARFSSFGHWANSLTPSKGANSRESNSSSSTTPPSSDSDEIEMTSHEDDDRGRLPGFEFGVDDDPMEYLAKVHNSCLGRSVGSSNTLDTFMMDIARKGCFRYLQRELASLAAMADLGGGKSWYAMKNDSKPDAAMRPTWEEFGKMFLTKSMPNVADIPALARQQAKKKQVERAPQHIARHKEKLVQEQAGFANDAAVDACTDQGRRDDFMETVATQMTPMMTKAYPGQDPRSQLEKDSIRNRTLGEDYASLIAIDRTLGRLCFNLSDGKTSNYLPNVRERKAAAAVQVVKDEEVNSLANPAELDEIDVKMSRLEARMEGRIKPLEKSIGDIQASAITTELSMKNMDSKLDKLLESNSSATYQQPYQQYNQSYQPYQQKGGKGKSGKGYSSKGKGGKSYYRQPWVQRATREPGCWNCGDLDHIMMNCPKTVSPARVFSVLNSQMDYNNGGTAEFSSWDVVSQFADVNYLAQNWDDGLGAYWVDSDLEDHSLKACAFWVQSKLGGGAGKMSQATATVGEHHGVAQRARRTCSSQTGCAEHRATGDAARSRVDQSTQSSTPIATAKSQQSQTDSHEGTATASAVAKAVPAGSDGPIEVEQPEHRPVAHIRTGGACDTCSCVGVEGGSPAAGETAAGEMCNRHELQEIVMAAEGCKVTATPLQEPIAHSRWAAGAQRESAKAHDRARHERDGTFQFSPTEAALVIGPATRELGALDCNHTRWLKLQQAATTVMRLSWTGSSKHNARTKPKKKAQIAARRRLYRTKVVAEQCVQVLRKALHLKRHLELVEECKAEIEVSEHDQAACRAAESEKDAMSRKKAKKARAGMNWSRMLRRADDMVLEVKRIAAAVAGSFQKHSAATIRIQLVDTGEWMQVIADTGASVSLWPQRKMRGRKLEPSALKLRAANGGGLSVSGCTELKFRIQGSDKVWQHKVEVVREGGAPNILGIDFWEPKQATLSMADRTIQLQHPSGSLETVPVAMMQHEMAAAVCTLDQQVKYAGKEIIRAECDLCLMPGEPVMMEWPVPTSMMDAPHLLWEPAKVEVPMVEAATEEDDDDIVWMDLTTTAVVEAMWSE